MNSVTPSLKELNSVALKLHSVISAKQDDPDLRMGVPSKTNWDALATKLKRGFFRKPFLTSNRTWVRNLVLDDPHAFAFLAPHIRLELIVNGKVRHWNGWGGEITRDPESPIDFLQDQLGPYLLEFLLGENSTLFVGILENLEGGEEVQVSSNLPESYNFNAIDLEMLTAASTLLKKVTAVEALQHEELVIITKLQHALSRLPQVTCGLNIKVSVQSPRHKFGEIETWHWWQVAIEDEHLSISSGGHFYRPSTGGDSFSTMSWVAVPGLPADFNDYCESLSLVPDVRSFPDAIAIIDFESETYNIEIYDEDNPLLDEMEDDDEEDCPGDEECVSNEEDDEESETNLEPQKPWSITPQNDVEKLLASKIDPTEVDRNEPQHAFGVEVCDLCSCSLEGCGMFVDGSLRNQTGWVNMCARCFKNHGKGIGWGKGQLYAKQQDGSWLMVAGFQHS